MQKHLIKIFFLFLIFGIAQSFYYTPTKQKNTPNIVIRAAIDIGSGTTKLLVAKVDTKRNKIKEVLFADHFPVPYQEYLEKSSDNTLDARIQQIGLDAIKKCKKIALEYKAEKIAGVATAAMRSASNSAAFVREILQETNVPIHIIDQTLEAKLAFKAVTANLNTPPEKIIVWDIGGGRFQLTTLSSPEKFLIYKGTYASVSFKNDIIKNIQRKKIGKVRTPNPMTPSDMDLARFKARKAAASVNEGFIKKIRHKGTIIVGVGGVFNGGIYPLVKNQLPFSRTQLSQAVEKLANLSDKDLGGGPYASVAVSNPILVLGFMEMLDISKVHVLNVNNAHGAIVHEIFWE